MLSALDVELLEAWAKREVPFEVVARGMRSAAEGALYDAPEGEGGLRSLAACKRKVEAEIKRYFGKAAGPGAGEEHRGGEAPAPAEDQPLHLVRFKKLKALLKKVGKAHPQLAPAAARLAGALEAPRDYPESARQEELVHAALLRALEWPRRSALLREAGSLVQKAPGLSAGARREALRFHRSALLKRELDLPR